MSAATTATRSITKYLTSPGNVAHALDWRKASGNLLSLTVLKDRIELAVASHPSFSDPIQPLPSIPLATTVVNNRKVLQPQVAEELNRIVKSLHVCGMVVSWPVQKEGWCGAQCGRVLHTLEELVSSNHSLFHPHNRPICLWDPEHNLMDEDEWGRTAIYSRTNTNDNDMHYASKEQFQDRPSVAANVWNDFVRVNWPDLFEKQHQQERVSSWRRTSAVAQEDSQAITTATKEEGRMVASSSSSSPSKAKVVIRMVPTDDDRDYA